MALRGNPSDESVFLHELMRVPVTDVGLTVHEALNVTSTSVGRAGPPPTASLFAIRTAQESGIDVAAVLDGIADRRASQNLRPGTARTYHSHLNQIRSACRLLGEDFLPAELYVIKRITSLVNNPVTLRGWLAAWRHIHVMANRAWLGDNDVFLHAIRTGLLKHVGPSPMRKRKGARCGAHCQLSC